ncbi:MAG: prepilin-type N-terminal cleavage/methylation domain-containing protein [Candidatus Eisenbacteria bacterium]
MNGERGLTMIEIIVVLAVMAVLAGISVPVATRQLEKSKIHATRQEMSDLSKSLRAYGSDVGFDPSDVRWGRFPAETAGTGAYRTILGTDLEVNATGTTWNPALRKGWNGPYISPERVRADPDGQGSEANVPGYQVDGWGRYYVYRNRNASGGRVRNGDVERVVTLTSGGPDRDPSTASDNITLVVYRGMIH